MIQSNTLARLLVAVGTAIAALALLAPLASAKTPEPGYSQFAGCPDQVENPAVILCIRSVINGGHFKMGSKDVPITNPMTLSGGVDGSFEKIFANAKGGLTPVKQQVPGGVIGITGLDWLVNFLGLEALKLYAVTELAGQPTIGDGTFLPIKVHLINSILGNNCYVGSVASPISLQLITGTTTPPGPNKPITGKLPSFSEDALHITHANGAEFVDNAFAAPGASGCVLTLFGFIPISINGLVNSQSGLPAAAGTNETRQNTDSEFVPRALVYK